MAAEFVALADLLRAPAGSPRVVREDATPPDATAAVAKPQSAPAAADLGVDGDVVRILREARLFRARLADAFDDAVARLLRELASDVLARELRLAPCDVAAIVRRIVQSAPVLRVRVAAIDRARGVPLPRGCDVAVVEDPALAGGDAIVELAGGSLDARLGVRLATVLEAFA